MQTPLDHLLLLHPAPWVLVPVPDLGTALDARGFVAGVWHDRAVAEGCVEAVNIAADFRQVVADFQEEVLGIAAASAACDEPAIGFLPPEARDVEA